MFPWEQATGEHLNQLDLKQFIHNVFEKDALEENSMSLGSRRALDAMTLYFPRSPGQHGDISPLVREDVVPSLSPIDGAAVSVDVAIEYVSIHTILQSL